jgi:gliding motility-associated-like protein
MKKLLHSAFYLLLFLLPTTLLAQVTPTIQASAVVATTTTTTSASLSWTSGNGTSRAVFVFKGTSGSPTIADGTTYTAATVFGSGTLAGTGWYCVFNGTTGNTVTVTGLTTTSAYMAMVVEYNGTAATSKYLTTTATGDPLTFYTVASPLGTGASAVVSTYFNMDWGAVTGASSYNYDVATDANFTSILTGYNNISTTNINAAITGLTPGTNYFFRVRTANAVGPSANIVVPVTTLTDPNFSGTYDFNSIASVVGATDITPPPLVTNLTFGAFTLSGATASAGAGRFAGNNWGTSIGAPLDATRYYSVTLTPATNYNVTISALNFTVQHSATGPANYSVRSSLDNYATDLPASSSNGLITVSGNVFALTTGNVTATNGSTITPGAGFVNLTGAVTFRFYAYNDGSAATTGSFSVDNVNFVGTVLINPPTVSYATPQTYLQNTAITTLTPTGALVAAPGFGTAAVGSAFLQPTGVARDASGNIYVADAGASAVYKMSSTGTGGTTIGAGIGGLGAIALDASGNMYVTEVTTGKLKKVTTGGVVTDIATFTQPTGVVLDASGNIFVADQATNLVSEIPFGSTTPTTIASGFNVPFGLTIGASGNLYVVNKGAGTLQMIAASGFAVSTIATGLGAPIGLTIDGAGNFYYTNQTNHTVNEIPQGTTTPAALSSSFTSPAGLVTDASGNIYVADATSGGSVKKVTRTGGYYITPALPAGLSMDGTTGAISGTPTVASIATNYTVTGFNIGGNGSATVNITVTPQPAIGTSGTLSALSTTYGTASSSGTFNVSGTNLNAGILVTPPTGFEVSTDNITFGGTVTIGAAGNVISTPVYIRLLANIAVGSSYSGNVVLTSSGANTVNVATVTSSVTKAPLTITANDVIKTFGGTLTGGTGSTAFTTTGLQNSETVGSVTITYGTGSAAGDAAGTYTGSVVPSAAANGTFSTANYTITYQAGNITVSSAPTPTISFTGTLSALTTTYGAASVSGTFNVSGANMTAGILVTPSAGFEVSTNNTTFGSTVTIGAAGTISSTPVYVRLLATAAATTYSGNIVLTSTNAINVNVATATSTINPAPITVAAKGISKTYGQTLTSGVASPTLYSINGTLQNGETITTVTLTYGTGGAATDAVGTYTGTEVPSNATGTNGFLASNYAITYANNNIIVNPAPLTITAGTANKVYGNALTGAAGATAFTSTGLQNLETIGSVTLAYGTGSAATATVNTYTGSATPSVATGGTFAASNYTITYAAGDIVVGKATLAITANTVNKIYGATLTGAAGATAFTSTGLANSETVGSVTLAYGTGAAATAVVNTYTGSVTPSAATGGTFAAGNYNITYTAGNIVVGTAPLTITASTANKAYGATLTGAAGSTAFSSTGLVNSETIGSVTIAYGTGSAATAAVNTYTGSVTPSAATGGTFAASNYAVTYAPGNIVVGKAALSITANNASKVYGVALTGAAGSTAFTSTGLVNSETIGTVTIAYGTGSAATAAGGAYTGSIVASGAIGGTFSTGNYNITYVAGNITVTPATLTVTVNNANKVYGAANPAFAAAYAGFVNGDNAASLTTQPTVTTTATATSGVGNYTLTAGGGVSSNYAFVYSGTGTLAVTPAPLTITADAKTKPYGSANPTLTATYTGFVGTDSQSSLTTLPTLTTTAVTNSLPGTYPIAISGAVTPNYTITYVAGVLTVAAGNNANLAFLTISSGSLSPAFASATKTYTDTVTNAADRISVTPTLSDPAANLQVNGTQVGSGNTSTFILLSIGNNTITILVTAQDGVTKNTYTVTVYRPVAANAITASNIMSPNGDGKNDAWVIKDINLYPNNNVNVYDRGGRVVYSKHGYTNDWTGTLRGAPLAEGTYYYTVELDPKLPVIKGFITILRTR